MRRAHHERKGRTHASARRQATILGFQAYCGQSRTSRLARAPRGHIDAARRHEPLREAKKPHVSTRRHARERRTRRERRRRRHRHHRQLPGASAGGPGPPLVCGRSRAPRAGGRGGEGAEKAEAARARRDPRRAAPLATVPGLRRSRRRSLPRPLPPRGGRLSFDRCRCIGRLCAEREARCSTFPQVPPRSLVPPLPRSLFFFSTPREGDAYHGGPSGALSAAADPRRASPAVAGDRARRGGARLRASSVRRGLIERGARSDEIFLGPGSREADSDG